jgi:hypothetical protein
MGIMDFRKVPDAALPTRLSTTSLNATYAGKAIETTVAAIPATYATKAELGDAGLQVVYHLGDDSVVRPDTTAAVMWVGWVAPLNMEDGDLYMEATEQEPVIAWHTAYSASAITTLADGASVDSLPDTSGNGRNAVQATGTKQPKWYGGTNPYVRFDGVDDFLQTTAFASPLAQPGTLILVAKLATVTTASSPTKEMVNGRTTGGEWSISQRGVSGNPGSEVWQAGAGTRRNGPATDKPVAAQWFILTFVVNGATSYLRVNGSQTANADYGTNSFDGITLGSLYNGLGGFVDMDLGELRLASTALDGTAVAELESYFAGKYGITL